MPDSDDSKYTLLYKRGTGKNKSRASLCQGNLDQLQRGDAVTFYLKDHGYVTSVVQKVNVRAQKLRVARTVINGWVMRPARTLDFRDVVYAYHPTHPDTLASAEGALREAEDQQARMPRGSE